ncbi:zinc finger protein 444-like [Solea senegalensis]|uniref:Zinc finger protein 444-like n=1 Tax=Solea senegalensis TaxID=28829 RepID=A0AAV6RVC8_SOLSE|nr:zinc finger protein 444-like [Solea senegalensis]
MPLEEIGEILILEDFLLYVSPELLKDFRFQGSNRPVVNAKSVGPLNEHGCTAYVQVINVTVNGMPARALLDTGSTETLVHPHPVDELETLTGGRHRVCCVNGDDRECPLVETCTRADL